MHKFVLSNGLPDYYAVLEVDDDASNEELKAAYRQLAKACHPDFTGQEGHNICVLLNEAYDTLMNPRAREAYNAQLELALRDEEDGFTGKPLSKWVPDLRPSWAKNEDPTESRAVFVDEQTCIGCKNCVWCSPATFRIEPEHGRSRVFAQWLDNEESIETAIQSCPVDCIHWVDKGKLPALEYAAQVLQKRVGVAVMMGQGRGGGDVFELADRFIRDRERMAERRKSASSEASPMQKAARREAADALARRRDGWFDVFQQRVRDSFADAAGFGSYSPPRNTAAAASSSSSNRRVGSRRRAKPWKSGAGGGMAGTIPTHLALVPILSDDEYTP